MPLAMGAGDKRKRGAAADHHWLTAYEVGSGQLSLSGEGFVVPKGVSD